MVKRWRESFLVLAIVILLAACSSGASAPATPFTAASSTSPARTVLPTATPTLPIKQEGLPRNFLNPHYPVMDWVFNITCSQAVQSYNDTSLNTAMAYDSAAWLFPSDGHLVEGGQDCDNAALVSQARAQNLPVLLTVGVDSSWSELALAQYIDQAAAQPQVPCDGQDTTYICNIVTMAIAGGYTGVIIDFEAVKITYPNIRAKFATFMRELQQVLHRKGLLCGVTLIHKVSDLATEDSSYIGNAFQDWSALSSLDFLVIMVLDFDLSLGQPGPLISYPWLDRQLTYLWQTVPQTLAKTIFEFPLYGREWQQDGHGTWHPGSTPTCGQVADIIAAYKLLSSDSSDPGAPEFAWNDARGRRHELWYDTNASLIMLMTQLQARARGLLNDPGYRLPTSFWYRGAECPGFFGRGGALEAFYQR